MNDRELIAYCLNLLSGTGADKAQCSLGRTVKYEMNVETGELSLIRTTFDTRLSMTVIKDNKKGSVTLNVLDKNSIDQKAEEAFELASGSEPDPANDIAEYQQPGEFSRGSSEPDRETMYARLKSFIADVHKYFPKVMLRNIYFDFTHHTTYYANTNNVDFKASKGIYDLGVIISSREGDKTSSFNYTGFSTTDLDREFLECGSIKTLLSQSEQQIYTQSIKGKFIGDLLIAPDCLDSFISYMVDSFLRDSALITGTSIYRDKLGQRIASPLFSLHSMPVSDELADGYFITPDGYRAQNSTIVDKGVLKGFVLSLYGSKKTGLEKAVNSGGAYVVDPGDSSFEEMVARIKRGILVCRFSGGRPSINGDFSGIAKNSFYIEDGEIKYPVSETMISGNLAELFLNINGISRERINFGSALLPWIGVSDMVISGK